MTNKFDLGKVLNKFGFKLLKDEQPLENKFNGGKELSDKISNQITWQTYRQDRWEARWQTFRQIYWQITRQIEESLNEK